MGLSATQSRMLTLTARMSDLELKAQRTQEAKIRLAEQSTEASKAYMDALNAQTLKFNYYSTGSVPATIRNITASGVYRIADAKGNSFVYIDEDYLRQNNLVGLYNKDGEKLPLGQWYIQDGKGEFWTPDGIDQHCMDDTDWLFEQLQLANLYIQKFDNEKGWEDFSYTSSSLFTTEDDDSHLAQAEAEYEFTMAQIQEKDKKFDLELENIQTEHSAVKQERDSINTIIDDNIKSSFNVFS